MLPHVIVLTPVKDATPFLDRYFELLARLDYPRELLTIGILESDSRDGTWTRLQDLQATVKEQFAAIKIFKRDFHFQMPAGLPRYAFGHQTARRSILARSRNYLLSCALQEQEWVLWIDVDVIDYPRDILRRLLAAGKEIITPNCVQHYGGKSFDLNAWYGRGKQHLHDLRHKGDVTPLHAVGGTMLLIRADLHREGLIFPPFLYGKRSRLIRRFNWLVPRRTLWQWRARPFQGEIETEGLGIMAHDMGYTCWGMPNLEILHRDS